MPEKQYFTGIDIINAPRIESLTVTEDGTYTASSDVIGYNPVVVNTNQPWQPLEDGYSNFWFELTNDTLSPWLNFSAKNNDAVIDWGDGSGEVALDTLTPTHTYAKAGKYVVKVKGVTGVNRTFAEVTSAGDYYKILKAIEFNSEVTILNYMSFANCLGLRNVYVHSGMTDIRTSAFSKSGLQSIHLPNTITTFFAAFDGCALLEEINIPTGTTAIASGTFQQCSGLQKITIPSAVSSISNAVFANCALLVEIHIAATTPPTLGTNVFYGQPSYYIIYVPQGTGETYKAAAGWSTYADHILEEGQTPNRVMLSRLAKETDTDDTDNTDNEEMR